MAPSPSLICNEILEIVQHQRQAISVSIIPGLQGVALEARHGREFGLRAPGPSPCNIQHKHRLEPIVTVGQKDQSTVRLRTEIGNPRPARAASTRVSSAAASGLKPPPFERP